MDRKATATGISLCAIGGVGSPMHIDLLGGHTFASIASSAVAVGLFLVAAVWMFRRWGGPPSVTLPEEQSDAIWAELEDLEAADATPAERTDREVPEPI